MNDADDDATSMAARDHPALDAATADAILDGRIAADDAPPGYGEVVAILRAADAPVRPDEIDGAPETIRRIFEEARRSPSPVPGPVAGDARRGGRWSLRAAVVAVVAIFTLGGGVAMAATGNLPGPLQSAASSVLGAVGVSVPDGPGDDADDPPDDPADVPVGDPTGDTAVDPISTATTATTTPVVPTTLGAEVPPAEQPPPTDPTGVPGQGDEVCELASAGRCRAGDPHPSDSRPSDPGPPTTKDNPSVTAPGRTTTVPPVTSPPTVETTRPRPDPPGRP